MTHARPAVRPAGAGRSAPPSPMLNLRPVNLRRTLFAVAPALGLLLAGLGLGEWSQRQAEEKDDIVIPWDEPGLKYEFSPGGIQNSHGYNEREVPVEKPPGTLRIAALGDSVTHGAFVRAQDAWPRKLEEALTAQGRTVQVLNFGVYGYDTESVAAQLRARALAFQPDLVVYAFYVNDPMPTEMVTADGRPIWVGTGPRDFQVISPAIDAWLHRGSALFRRFEGASAARAIAARPRAELLDWDRFGGWLTDLRDVAADAKVPLVTLVVPPHPLVNEDMAACNASAAMGPNFCEDNLEVVARAAAFAQDRHMATVDGLAAYRAAGNADLHGRADDPHHPSPEGHRRLAAALAPVVGPMLDAR
jgi:lysophospholipase L1-like esterase